MAAKKNGNGGGGLGDYGFKILTELQKLNASVDELMVDVKDIKASALARHLDHEKPLQTVEAKLGLR